MPEIETKRSRDIAPNASEQRPQFISMGCRLNGYESEAMRKLSATAGLTNAVIVNSCAVTNEAVRQTRQSIRRARRDNPEAKIIVTGCAAQVDPASFSQMAEVDTVLGNQEKLDAREWGALAKENTPPQRAQADIRVNDIMSVRDTAAHLIDGYGDRARAFMQIQNGCDHRCTFCIIPYGRGNSRSVPIADCVMQAQRLASNGHREIVLTGVDITSYGEDLEQAPHLGDLVGAILDEVPDLYQLRLSSIDGAEIDETLIDRIASDHRIAPYLHLSLQSGDDMILKRMKRRHTRAQAIDFCHELRARRPEIAFGADIIAGFPTETEQMFKNSLELIDDAGLQYLHVFPFSPRQGTPAARMPQLDRHIIKERAKRLRDKGTMAHHAFLDSLIGKTHMAIAETGHRARLANFAEVRLDSTQHITPGSLVSVDIIARDDKSLIGSIADDPQK